MTNSAGSACADPIRTVDDPTSKTCPSLPIDCIGINAMPVILLDGDVKGDALALEVADAFRKLGDCERGSS